MHMLSHPYHTLPAALMKLSADADTFDVLIRAVLCLLVLRRTAGATRVLRN
jgi:hypothetical protein